MYNGSIHVMTECTCLSACVSCACVVLCNDSVRMSVCLPVCVCSTAYLITFDARSHDARVVSCPST